MVLSRLPPHWKSGKVVEELDLLKALTKMRKTCKVIKYCFLAATVVFSVFWLSIVAMLVTDWIGRGMDVAGTVIYAVTFGAFVILTLWNLTKLFGEVDKGGAPFSETQADRLQAIAVIALAIAILDALISVGFILEPMPELGFGMVANDGITEPTINIKFGMLAFSAIMYSLSAIFRYAALLQQLSDETV